MFGQMFDPDHDEHLFVEYWITHCLSKKFVELPAKVSNFCWTFVDRTFVRHAPQTNRTFVEHLFIEHCIKHLIEHFNNNWMDKSSSNKCSVYPQTHRTFDRRNVRSNVRYRLRPKWIDVGPQIYRTNVRRTNLFDATKFGSFAGAFLMEHLFG